MSTRRGEEYIYYPKGKIYTKHVTACLNLVDSSKPSHAVAQRVHTVNAFGITLDKYGATHPKSEFR